MRQAVPTSSESVRERAARLAVATGLVIAGALPGAYYAVNEEARGSNGWLLAGIGGVMLIAGVVAAVLSAGRRSMPGGSHIGTGEPAIARALAERHLLMELSRV